MHSICLTADLATSSRLAGAAARAGARMSTALDSDGLFARVADESASLVLIDLTVPRIDLADVVERLKALSPPPAIVAFGPHVHEARLAAARAAGCDEVLTRGQMHAQVDDVLARYGTD